MEHFGSLGEAFLTLSSLMDAHGDDGSARDRRARTLHGVAFRLDVPTARLIDLKSRRPNLAFLVAETLWQIQARQDVAMLEHYAPRIGAFGAHYGVFRGSAYGPVIFRGGAYSEWVKVRSLLREDPGTRRAVIFVGGLIAGERGASELDYPCTTSLQFVRRSAALDLHVHMRSNDLMRGLQSDVFFATVLLELMARELGVPVGHYYHMVNLLQVYQMDAAWAHACSSDELRSDGSFPLDEPYANLESVATLCQYEESLRTEGTTLGDLHCTSRWAEVLRRFSTDRPRDWNDWAQARQ